MLDKAKGLDKEKVNHPDHYNSGKFEAMEVIADAGYGEGFCLGNVLKYTLRAKHKEDEVEDLKKARWYLDYWIQLLEGKTKQESFDFYSQGRYI